MKSALAHDRRAHRRFPQLLDVQASEIVAADYHEKAHAPALGRTQDVSQGGVCFWSRVPIPASSLLMCEFLISKTPVGVPTLMRVRWTKRQKLRNESYLSGLEFLF